MVNPHEVYMNGFYTYPLKKSSVSFIPSHGVHNKYDMQVFGCPYGTYQWVHEMMDTPFAALFGRDHRKILHSIDGVEAIRRQYGDFIATIAMHHLTLDFPKTFLIQNGRLVKVTQTRRKTRNL